MEAIRNPLFKNVNAFANYRFSSGFLTTDSKGGHTLSIGAGTPIATTGKYGGGISLDTSSYYQRATAFTAGGSWSFNAWVRNWLGSIFSCKSGSSEVYFQISGTTLNLTSVSTDGSSVSVSIGLPAGFNAAIYNMVTVVAHLSGADTVYYIYCNGTEIYNTGTTYNGKFPGAMESPYLIGSYYIEGKNGTLGDVDDIFMYTDAFTASEVRSLYVNRGFPIVALF